jgi:hypothetical protein
MIHSLSQNNAFATTTSGIKLGVVLWHPQKLSESQLRFAAEKFDMIMLGGGRRSNEIAPDLKQLNPDLIILKYINARQIVEGSQYYKECKDENLFAHDSNGRRIKNQTFDQWLMDIHNPAWQAKLIKWANEKSSGINGIFLDDASPVLYDYNFKHLPEAYEKNQYASSMNKMLEGIKKNTDGLVFINGLAQGVKHKGYIEKLDGGLIEGFIFTSHNQNVRLGRLRDGLNGLIKAGNANKTAYVATKSFMDNIHNRVFALACYLLGSYANSGYNFTDINNYATNPLQYYPEYEVNLGPPIDHPKKIDDLLVPRTQLAVRHFKLGMVVVNPWKEEKQIQLESSFEKVIPRGGGIVSKDGLKEGNLSYERISGLVKIPPESAFILRRP